MTDDTPDERGGTTTNATQALQRFNDSYSAMRLSATEALRSICDAVASFANTPAVKAAIDERRRQQMPSLPRHGAGRAMRERRRRV